MAYLFIAIGGAVGAILRYLISNFNFISMTFPLPTLVINLFGSFVLAWFTTKLKHSFKLSPYIVSAIGTGLLGSFTTFSTFSIETVKLFDNNHYLLAFIYIALSVSGGLLTAYLGYRLGTTQNETRGQNAN